MILRDVHEQLKSNKVSPSRSIFSQVSLAPPRITASQRELKLNKVSPLRSKTVLKSFLPPREMVNVPEATAFCNIVNVPEDRSRRNQCISDAKPKCAQTAAEETNAFPMQTQMCTNCSRRNQCILQRPSVQNCSRRNQCVPNVQIFSCARESPGLPRCTLMQRPQVPGANVHKCRKKFNADAMPDAIQCSSSAKSQSFHGAAIFCRTRFTK